MGPAAMTAARQQQEEEQLLASCLGLLDIRQTEGAKQLDISAGTFRKPNAKAFELVLYHTYNVIKGKAAAKKVNITHNCASPGWCFGVLTRADPFLVACAHHRTFGACGHCPRRTRSWPRTSTRWVRENSSSSSRRHLCISCHPWREPPGVSVGADCATPWMCWMFSGVLQRIQEWLKESGRSEHSLAAFQRNPSGPK